MRRSILGVAIFVCLVGGQGRAEAGIIFDNFKGTGISTYTEETRDANETFGTVLNSTSMTTINGMQFRWRPDNDMNVTFFIFDSGLGGSYGSLDWTPTGNNVLFSQTKFFSAVQGPVDYWLTTDPFSFTFQANHRYDIGLIGDNGTLTGSWDALNGFTAINTVQGGFESINRNANLDDTPRSDVGYAGVDPHIRLTTADATAVPEPSSLALLGVALATLAGYRTLKMRKSAAAA